MIFFKRQSFYFLLVLSTFLFSCSEGESSNNLSNKKEVQNISITTEKDSYYLGTNIRVNVTFNGFDSIPNTVNVITDNGYKQSESIFTLQEGSYILIPTDNYFEGNYRIYFKYENIISNNLSLTLITKPEIEFYFDQGQADANGNYGLGDTITFFYHIYNSTLLPAEIELFCDDNSEPINIFNIQSFIDKLTFSTAGFTESDHTFYIKYENQESNKVKINLVQKNITIKVADTNDTEGDCIITELSSNAWYGKVKINISFDGIKPDNQSIYYYLSKGNEEPESGEFYGSYEHEIYLRYPELNATYTYYLQYGNIKSNTITIHTKKYCVISLKSYSYNGNYYDDSTYDYQNILTNTNVELPKINTLGFTVNNAEFLGWSDNSNSNEVIYKDGQICTTLDDLTLYAVWNLFPPDTTITIEPAKRWISYDTGNDNWTEFSTEISNYIRIHIPEEEFKGEEIEYFYNTANDFKTATKIDNVYSPLYLAETRTYYFWIRRRIGTNTYSTPSSGIEYNNTYKPLQTPTILGQKKIVYEDGSIDRYLIFSRTGAMGYHIYASDTNNPGLLLHIGRTDLTKHYTYGIASGKYGHDGPSDFENRQQQGEDFLTIWIGSENSFTGTQYERFSTSHKYKYYWVKSAEMENYNVNTGLTPYTIESDYSEAYEWQD